VLNPTLKDLSQHLGVDISTVSRALNGSPRVKEATRQHILDEANRLGYRPNLNARRLQSGRTKTVYFILPSLYDQERIPAEEATKVLAKAGYDTLLAVHHHDEHALKRLIHRLSEGVADGALIISDRQHLLANSLKPLVQQGFPILFLDRPLEKLNLPVVTSQNRKGASDLITKIHDDGVQHVLVNLPPINAVQKERAKGFEMGIKKNGLTLLPLGSKNSPMNGQEPAPIGLLGNSQDHVLHTLRDHVWLKDHPLVFGVFDAWSGDPHPASHVYTAIQNFGSMGNRAANRLLHWMQKGTPPKNLTENVPLKEVSKVLPLWT
jgi:DNA-binding LacI/PurR family transcriptional regulator